MIKKTELFELINKAELITFPIEKIIFNRKFYSRVSGIDQAAVVDYSQDIINIPFILINQNNYIVNGVHCYHALLKANQKQAKVKIIELPDKDVEIAGYIVDIDSGVRHPEKDKKKVCVNYYSPEPTENKLLMDELKIPERTFYRWTNDIRKQKQKEINRLMMAALLDPYRTQENIADEFGVQSRTVIRYKNELSDIFDTMAKMSDDDEKQDFLKTLKEKDFDFLQDYLNFKPFLYNIWNLKNRDGTNDYYGHFPKVFMDNLLHYHTKPFDLVYDPFAGGGTTIDSCASLYRKCIATDLQPIKDRLDAITQHDITIGLPENMLKPALVFLDPPYWKQAKDKYSDVANDLGNMSLDVFNSTVSNFLAESQKRKIKRIAIVIQPTQYSNDFGYVDHILDFHKMFGKNYVVEMRYILPYSSQQYNAQMVNAAKDVNKCLVLNRDLVVWKLKE